MEEACGRCDLGYMKARDLDVNLFNKAYRFAEKTGVIPQNATDSEISALLEVVDDKSSVIRFVKLCKTSLLPPFYGYKILLSGGKMYLCTLLLTEDCKYTLDEYYPGCGRSDKALVTEIVPCFGTQKTDEVLSVFMGEPMLYKVGEYVVANYFNTDEVKNGIHFFPDKCHAFNFALQYRNHVVCKDMSPCAYEVSTDTNIKFDEMPGIIREIRGYSHSMWTLGEIYGVKHWDRVYRNGQRLLTPKVNPLVVGLFAYLHDSCRSGDGKDIEHGKRASIRIDNLRSSFLKDVSDEEIELLKEACSLHTTTHKTGHPTIDACFDADRLDLWRVGIFPDPQKMATEKGKEIALKEFQRKRNILHETII